MHKHTERALDILKERIEKGVFPANNFLPAERKLCEELGIGRGALSAIFKELTSAGYIRIDPGRGARVLPRKKHKFRRILVVESSEFRLNHSSEHLRIFDGISTAASAVGAEMVLSFAGADITAESLIDRYAGGEYQGIIIAEMFRISSLNMLIRYGIPTVVANSESPEKTVCTQVDFREVGRIAGRELFDNGHVNIGMLCGPVESYISKEMLAGLKGALAEDDIAVRHENIIFWDDRNEEIEKQLVGRLTSSDRPTAFFVARDWRAARLYEFCGRLGIRIPEDISVISYDDLSWPSAVQAGLTTVSEPASELGGKAVSMLAEWVETGRQPESVTVRGTLVRRNSVRTI